MVRWWMIVVAVCGCSSSLLPGRNGEPAPASCSDGVLDDAETDVDCGGPCAPCSGGLHCLGSGDCVGQLCTNTICAGPGPADLGPIGDGPQGMNGAPDGLAPPDLSPALCPLRPMGEWHVSAAGSDQATPYAGNGSSACPLRTLGRAVDLAQLDGLSATIYLHQAVVRPTPYFGASISLRPGQSLAIQGDSIADIEIHGEIDITGGASPDKVTISKLTIKANAGAPGLMILSNPDVVVEDVTIPGGQGIGINDNGAGSARFGPGLTIDGAAAQGIAVYSTTTSALVGTPQRPSSIRNATESCVSGVSSVGGNVTLTNCRKTAIVGVAQVNGVVVVGGGDGLNAAVSAAAISETQIIGYQGDAIACTNCTISGNVQVTGTLLGAGVHVTSGAASITGLLATGNHVDGLRCEGTSSLKLRGSTLTGNDGNGLLAFGGCALDLGTATDPGNNQLNRTGAKNGTSGLCLLQTAGTGLSMSSCRFGCGYTGSGCVQSGTPATSSASSCQVADITLGPSLTLSTTGSSCCN